MNTYRKGKQFNTYKFNNFPLKSGIAEANYYKMDKQ